MKKYSLKFVDKVCKPTYWIARHLSKYVPHNTRKSQIVIGMLLLAAGCVIEGMYEHHLAVQVCAAEPLKAIGAAPICRLILDFLEWES